MLILCIVSFRHSHLTKKIWKEVFEFLKALAETSQVRYPIEI